MKEQGRLALTCACLPLYVCLCASAAGVATARGASVFRALAHPQGSLVEDGDQVMPSVQLESVGDAGAEVTTDVPRGAAAGATTVATVPQEQSAISSVRSRREDDVEARVAAEAQGSAPVHGPSPVAFSRADPRAAPLRPPSGIRPPSHVLAEQAEAEAEAEAAAMEADHTEIRYRGPVAATVKDSRHADLAASVLAPGSASGRGAQPTGVLGAAVAALADPLHRFFSR
mmetsp:Transcript_114772/g.244955  ORF Transcript_114772/g.244955 Transcript_114772/m.244955 type:complete len:229 (-) Transcript_114772:30-716(-)